MNTTPLSNETKAQLFRLLEAIENNLGELVALDDTKPSHNSILGGHKRRTRRADLINLMCKDFKLIGSILQAEQRLGTEAPLFADPTRSLRERLACAREFIHSLPTEHQARLGKHSQ